MKKYFFFFIFFNILIFKASAEIVYIDMNFVLKESKVGKSLNTHITKIKNKNSTKFKEIEEDLKKKENILLTQQNILSKSEFEKKIKILSSEIDEYRKNKKISEEELNKLMIKNTKEILELLNPIITNYVESHSIIMVLPKKNIIVGKKNLDITNQIVDLLNKKIQKLNF